MVDQEKTMTRARNTSLVIALQCCPLDIDDAVKLARLICDIEPEKRSDVEFACLYRRDTNPFMVDKILELAKAKFNVVHKIKSKRFGVGWPAGCNDLWEDGMTQLSMLSRSGKSGASGALTIEADCVPILPAWINVLIAEWEDKRKRYEVVGHAHSVVEGQPPQHLNGNGIFSIDITRRFPELAGSDAAIGWDVYHGALLMKIGFDSDLIHQRYATRSISLKAFKAIRKNGTIPALLHGMKDSLGVRLIREMIKDGSFYDLSLRGEHEEEPQQASYCSSSSSQAL